MGKTNDFAVASNGDQHHDSPPAPHQDEAGRGMRQDEYMMFIDNNDDDGASLTAQLPPTINEDPVPPPPYQKEEASESANEQVNNECLPIEKHSTAADTSSGQATATSSSTTTLAKVTVPPTLHFYKGTGFSSKARLSSPNTDGRSFLLVADIHKSSSSSPSTIRIYSSPSSSSNNCLGSVVFPPGDNSFQILMSRDGGSGSEQEQQLLQVRARVGSPHVSEFRFVLPTMSGKESGIGRKGREVVWTRVPAAGGKGGGYDLADATWRIPIAKWRFVQGQKYDVELSFSAADGVRGEAELVAIVLSFIGCMSRLKLKGKDLSGMPRSGRWGAFWFMAILGMAGMS